MHAYGAGQLPLPSCVCKAVARIKVVLALLM